ncbi:MAG: matrixin family metalloprotease [Planctomycetes bacterium]|nr:matrixin family metalloprotease [Planctomycetota bacterium]
MAQFNLSKWFETLTPRRQRRRITKGADRRRRSFVVEQLEDRIVPSGWNAFKPDMLLPGEEGEDQIIQNEATLEEVGPSAGQSEMAIAADPTGQHVVIGFNDFQGFNNNPLSVSGFAYSDNGGASFTYGNQLPSASNGNIGATLLPQVVGDPVILYIPGGGGGQFAYFSIEVIGRGVGSPGNTFAGTIQTMCVQTSTDFGHTWSQPFAIGPASNPHGLLSGTNGRDAADKEFADVDPETGRVMLTWSNFTSTAFIPGGREISATYTDNIMNAGGPTWSARQILNPGATTADQASVPRFAGNGSGNVYVSWNSTNLSTGNNREYVAVSTNNGVSFGAPFSPTASDYYPMDQVLGNDRVHSFPSLAVDNSGGVNAGNVYLVYATNGNHDGADIIFHRSTNGGGSFSAGTLLNARPGSDRAQWFPYVSVDNTNGRVSVIYLDQGVAGSGDLTEVSWQYSDDGGVTWSKPSSLTSPGAFAIGGDPADAQPFHAGYGNDTSQPNMGDYIASTSVGGNLFATWGGTNHIPDFQSGQPTSASFTTPDFFFKKSSTGLASLHLGTPTFTDSGGNGFIDSGELINFHLPLTNYVTNPVLAPSSYTGVTATLSTSTPGVVVTVATVAYPDIAAGGTQLNSLDFQVTLLPTFVPGTRIEFSLAVTTAQGSTALLFTQTTGTPIATTIFSENFDGVAPGSLPAGWGTIHQGGANTVPWTTSNTQMGTASNGLYHQEANDGPGGTNNTRFERVASPLITIPANSLFVTLDFDIRYDLEDDFSTNPGYTGQNILAYDGADLRITDFTPGHFARATQIEAFEQSFTTDGFNFYNKHLPRSGNAAYFQDQSVWSGSSGGFVHVHMVLGGMAGTTVQLRPDYTQDGGGLASSERPGALNGVMIDNIVMQSVVANQPPKITSLSATSPINENDSSTVNGTFTDEAGDTHTVVINWGPGEGSTTLNLAAGNFSFSSSHQYKDDNPTGTPSDVYPVSVTVNDNVGMSDTQGTSVTVNNLVPVVGVITGPNTGMPGQVLAFSAPFTDVGTQDTHTVSIDWGDGNITSGAIVEASGSGTASGSHAYGSNGTYTVTFTVTDDDTGAGTAAKSGIVIATYYVVLNPTAPGALSVSGNASLNPSGGIFVDSTSSTGLTASGNALITSPFVNIAGGAQITGNAHVVAAPTPGSMADPFAALLAPSPAGGSPPNIQVSGNTSTAIGPGTYASIKVSGNGSLALAPGVYYIQGGGLSVSGNGSVTGTGITIYNAGGPGGAFGGVSFSGNGVFQLSAPNSGDFTGILIFQARDNTRAMSISGNAGLGISGSIYAKAALLSLSGNGQLHGSLVVDRFQASGNGASALTADGNDNAAALTAGELLGGDLFLYIDDASGYLGAAGRARIHDIVVSLDNLLARYDIAITEVSSRTLANLVLDTSTTSASGGFANGVLGSFTNAGEITLIQGWSWYVGSDPAGIGANQYDLETIVAHELGHALGLGHSSAGSSTMFAELAPGAARRTITTADLNIRDAHGGPDALHAAGFQHVAAARLSMSAPVAADRSGSPDVAAAFRSASAPVLDQEYTVTSSRLIPLVTTPVSAVGPFALSAARLLAPVAYRGGDGENWLPVDDEAPADWPARLPEPRSTGPACEPSAAFENDFDPTSYSRVCDDYFAECALIADAAPTEFPSAAADPMLFGMAAAALLGASFGQARTKEELARQTKQRCRIKQ